MGGAYSQQLAASGGTGAYTFTVLSGALPAGLTLSSGGVISGTPTTLGFPPVTIQATDGSACPGVIAYTIVIAAAFRPCLRPSPSCSRWGSSWSDSCGCGAGLEWSGRRDAGMAEGAYRMTDRLTGTEGQRLAQALEYANTLIRSSPDGVLAVDLNLRITEWNLLMEQMCGRSREQEIGRDLAEIPFMKETGEGARIREGLEGKSVGPREVAYRIPGEDTDRLFESVMAPLRGPAGEILGAVLRVRDITERKQAELATSESEKKYRQLFESSRDALMIIRPPSWRFTDANRAMLQMFGGASIADFTVLGPWDLSPERQPDGGSSAERAQEMIATALREGSSFFEWEHQRLNGKPFAAEVLLTRIEADGQFFLKGTVRDISARKRAEEHILTLNQALEEKVRQLLGAGRTGTAPRTPGTGGGPANRQAYGSTAHRPSRQLGMGSSQQYAELVG